jgi:hypothetical protein
MGMSVSDRLKRNGIFVYIKNVLMYIALLIGPGQYQK